MNKLRLFLAGLVISCSLLVTSPTSAVACSGVSNLHALELCFDKCRDLYSGDSVFAITARSACFAGCQIGCLIYGQS